MEISTEQHIEKCITCSTVFIVKVKKNEHQHPFLETIPITQVKYIHSTIVSILS